MPQVQASRAVLSGSIETLWRAEQEFFRALTKRLELLVRRQAYDRQCWDLLNAASVHLGLVLNSSAPSPELDNSVPEMDLSRANASSGTEILRKIAQFLEQNLERERPAFGLTMANSARLLQEGETLAAQGRELGRRLRGIARQMQGATRKMQEHLSLIHDSFNYVLRRGDPRWIGVPVMAPRQTPKITSARSNRCYDVRALSCAPPQSGFSSAGSGTTDEVGRATAGLSIMGAVCLLLPPPRAVRRVPRRALSGR
jgi:hypothetical protein